ncbi:PadR family transcriptional regulator [Naasia sp. SYSU D00057]|uniref:PadR family transcriptional regulator n=1 Tax=Naasia sp. SYSU D00057 TaxID=2817380 RepID=UPI001B30ACBA|nr:PadR family transcriptional regulator [Naasia sp. SYSU D00057]
MNVFGHGRLRLYVLSLLAERPRHGYELIQALEERSGGTYSPSAGTIYPRLAKLEEDGLVRRDSDGRRTVYAITDAGRRELDERRDELAGIENDLSDSVRRIADEVRSGVDAAMKSLRAELAAAASAARGEARSASASASASSSAPGPEPGSGESADGHRSAWRDTGTELRNAEVVLADFRHRVRGDLRAASARGGIPADVVPLLEERLAALRTEISGRLP